MRTNCAPASKARAFPLAILAALSLAIAQTGAAVSIERLPGSGLQPQAIAAPDGTVHLIYLTGEAKASDILYRRRTPDGGWSDPLKVNSQSGSAVAIGTIRGPQLALGRNGRAHVVWNGSQSAAPTNSTEAARSPPMPRAACSWSGTLRPPDNEAKRTARCSSRCPPTTEKPSRRNMPSARRAVARAAAAV